MKSVLLLSGGAYLSIKVLLLPYVAIIEFTSTLLLLFDFALEIAFRNLGLAFGSPPAKRADIVISLIILVKIFPLF